MAGSPAVHLIIARSQRFKRGSAASRKPSPIRLYDVTVRKMARPGKAVNHHALGSNSRAPERIEPQLAVEVGVPNPRKLSVDSIRIADATPNVAATNTGANEFGRTCLKIDLKYVAPIAHAVRTYPSDLILNKSPRVSLATVGQLVSPITSMMLNTLCGKKAATVMIRKKAGIVSIISIRREAMMSRTPP